MKIRLPADYRGELTQERYYLAGDYEEGGEIPLSFMQALVAAGRAVVLDAVEPPTATPLDSLPGVGREIADVLINAGYTTLEAVHTASDEALLAIAGIGPKRLKEIRSWKIG